MPPPLIVHLHVPKCAGTSFRTLLQECFGKNHANLYVDDSPFYYSESYLDEFIASRPTLRSISSHFIRTFPPRMGGRDVLYITFLRQPVEQFVSFLTYTRKYFHEIPDTALLDRVPPRASELSSREFADWILSHKVPYSQNFQTHFYTKVHFRAIHPEWDEELFCASRLLLAKTITQQFFFIGIAERMDESMDRLRHLGDRFGVELPSGPIGMENVSSENRDDLDWINPSDDVGARLLASLADDQALYDWSLARFEHADPDMEAGRTADPKPAQRPSEIPAVIQLYWRFQGEGFNESQSVCRRWSAPSSGIALRLDLPRLDRVPAEFRLDLADRPINLHVDRVALADASGVEVWRLGLRTPPATLSMSGMTLVADEEIGGFMVRIENWDGALLLPLEADELARLGSGGMLEILMTET